MKVDELKALIRELIKTELDEVSTTGTGLIYLGAFNNATVIVNQGFNATSSVITHTFTANTTTNPITCSIFYSL